MAMPARVSDGRTCCGGKGAGVRSVGGKGPGVRSVGGKGRECVQSAARAGTSVTWLIMSMRVLHSISTVPV